MKLRQPPLIVLFTRGCHRDWPLVGKHHHQKFWCRFSGRRSNCLAQGRSQPNILQTGQLVGTKQLEQLLHAAVMHRVIAG
jgi:hypothetical protein